MSRMLSKMNLMSVVQKLLKEDIETIQGYVEMIEEENKQLKEKLDKYENPEDMTLFAMWCTEKVKDENLELKKQLENCYCNRTDCSGRIKDSKKYDSLIQAQEVQQKEFIKFLENELLQARYYARDIAHYIEYVLRKYKKLIGVSDEKTN